MIFKNINEIAGVTEKNYFKEKNDNKYKYEYERNFRKIYRQSSFQNI